ncbi:hypothetical protein MmTuc01_2033 [Methanosarcina mazei Tuc01]|uniref:Uncharacterized protein n=1 Tax=Methanosarcina mazei Tuc01 TaxID=1236903 RepID=M1Q4Y3_METMZ|nr:hypothetical protein MmTuc01_2033 [Methanosarcina mazei Tuc01]
MFDFLIIYSSLILLIDMNEKRNNNASKISIKRTNEKL